MRNFIKYGLILVFLAGCQTAPKPTVELPVFTDPIYPFGLYTHRVKLQVGQGEEMKRHEFTAMVRVKREKFAMALLGPMGITLATFEDDFAHNERKLKIAVRDMKKNEKQVEQFFLLLQNLILYPRREQKIGGFQVVERDRNQQPSKLVYRSEMGEGQILLAKYVGQGPAAWPQQLTIETDRFRSEAEVKLDEAH